MGASRESNYLANGRFGHETEVQGLYSLMADFEDEEERRTLSLELRWTTGCGQKETSPSLAATY